jgi:hypothetical protein
MTAGRTALAAGLAALVVVACGGPTPSLAPSPSPSAAVAPTASLTPIPSPAVTMSGDEVLVDPLLIDVLPEVAAGAERRPDEESAVELAATPDLRGVVRTLALALYIDGDDYAVASVIRPRPEIATDQWFRTWRDDFDAGVCEQAGGVDPGHSQFEVDGRTVYRSTCAGGVTIYHVKLEAPARVVSIQGAGTTDLGRAIVDDLTE